MLHKKFKAVLQSIKHNYNFIFTSRPFEVWDLEDFLPKSTVLIHFPGDFPIAKRLEFAVTQTSISLSASCKGYYLFHLSNLIWRNHLQHKQYHEIKEAEIHRKYLNHVPVQHLVISTILPKLKGTCEVIYVHIVF